MILGHVRDKFPRIMLPLPGLNGAVNVEFIVDTGFDGELTVPATVLSQLDATYLTDRMVRLADGRQVYRSAYTVELAWDGEFRTTEVIVLENIPLLGVELMDGKLLQSEMTDGDEVSLDDL